MKKIVLALIILIQNLLLSQDFDTYFTKNQLRIDFNIVGNSEITNAYLVQIKKEKYYGGSQKNLIDNFNYGNFYFKVFEKESGKLIYSRGFSTLFEEWQRTPQAKHSKKSFYQTIVMPFPKVDISIKIECIDYNTGIFSEVLNIDVSKDDYLIKQDYPPDFKVTKFLDNGNAKNKIDIVVVSEGYTKDEMQKFKSDVERLFNYFFQISPFQELKNNFNIYTVEAISRESGTDIPKDAIWKETILNSHFYTFDSERYLTTSDVNTLRNIASAVPYDQIIILVNTDKYGGGGIYNHYNIATSSNSKSNEVFVHEFGHGFAGLGDEYVYGEDDFFNKKIEPWCVNLTTMVDFDKKWKKLIDKNTPIPTPNDKKYENTLGVFEGGGYTSKGVYRPYLHCIMREIQTKHFCPVCNDATKKLILWLCE